MTPLKIGVGFRFHPRTRSKIHLESGDPMQLVLVLVIMFLFSVGTLVADTMRRGSVGRDTLLASDREHVSVGASDPMVDPVDTSLVTGWYYIVDTATAFSRTAIDSDESFFLLPTPIVSINNFISAELVEGTPGVEWDMHLLIQLDPPGTVAWARATASWIDRRVGFIADNRLLLAPVVRSAIESGKTAIIGSTLTREDLLEIRRKISLARPEEQ